MRPKSASRDAVAPAASGRRYFLAVVAGALVALTVQVGRVANPPSAAESGRAPGHPRPLHPAPLTLVAAAQTAPPAVEILPAAPADRSPTAFFESLRQADSLEALAMLDALGTPDATFLFEAYSAVLEPIISSGGFTAARDILATTPRADVRQLLVAAFGEVWARVAPADAAAWLAALPPDPNQPRLLADVVSGWAAREVRPALAFAWALPPGEARRGALAGAVRQWAIRDPHGAEAWLQSSPADPDCAAARSALAAPRTADAVASADGARADE